MFTANLLPPEEKIAIRREELRLLIRFFSLAGIGALMLGILFLLPTYLTVAFTRREAARALEFEEEAAQKLKVAETEKQVGEAQAALRSLEGFLADSGRVSGLLEKFLGETSGIVLSNLTVRQDGKFTLTAHAATRRDLLAFEETLRSSGIFQELSFPLSNLVRETDINFTLQGTLSALNRL